MPTRRLFLSACASLALAPALAPALASTRTRAVRVGLTPVFVDDQPGMLADWRAYMGAKLQQPVEFVQRNSYREVMDLLRLEKLDFAWICDYPFVYLHKQVRLLAAPLFKGRPYYRAYLIVPARMTQVTSLLDLRNKIFAYADPYSNTGYLEPRYQLRQMGEDPATFFRRTFFTYSHINLVKAVAVSLADGGSVDSFVWDSLYRDRPDLARRTRIVSQSPEYGFPPFVANHTVPKESFLSMQRMLLTMADDAAGKVLLKQLNLDGFVVGDARNYELVARMMRAFSEG